MTETFRIEDRGDHRVLWVGGRPSMPTHYSERVIRMLIERKGADRAPLYFPFKAERAPHFLGPLFRYLRARGAAGLRVLEVGCSFGHMTEYLSEQPEIAALSTFDTDAAFVEIARTKAKELGLTVVREILLLDQARRAICHGPTAPSISSWPSAWSSISRSVIGAPRSTSTGGCSRRAATSPSSTRPTAIFRYETHSLRLPFVQFLPPRLAYRYARLVPDAPLVSFDVFTADGTGWRNATIAECLPSGGRAGVVDVTEEAGYGLRYFRDTFFRDTARSRTRGALLPLFGALAGSLAAAGLPPSQALPYLNLLFRRAR